MRLKSQDAKKHHYIPYYTHIPNFNYLAQFGEELYEEPTLKIRKPYINFIFKVVRRCNVAEKSRIPKGTSKTLIKCVYQISTSQFHLEGSYANNKLKK